MGPSYPVVPSDSNSPRPRGAGALSRSFAPPRHQASAMDLETGVPLRAECWDGMGAAVRQRLIDRAGTIIEWWAATDSSSADGRAGAVVFGDHALCLAEPRINAEHRAVYAVKAYILEPSSLRRISIDHRPPSGGRGRTPGPTPPAADIDLGLSPAGRGLLGNLPPKAQELLQAPFTSGQRVMRCDWHYEGSEHRLNMFMVYLAGAQDVTVATGTKEVPVGHGPQTAHWALTCYRASVVRRVGV
jgi:hypothetical protein